MSPPRLTLLFLFLLPSMSLFAAGQTGVVHSEQADFRVVTVAERLEFPWSLAFLPGGDMLVTERPGRLRRVHEGKLLPEPVAGTPPVAQVRYTGLLEVALHPAFADNGFLYLCYAHGTDAYNTARVLRSVLEGDHLTDTRVIFESDATNADGDHHGCRMAFDREGYLYVTLGDRYDFKEQAQNLATHYGTIIRLRDDGSVPADNPFAGQQGARPEIWSYGHRNPQGLVMHPSTGQLWSHEHGPKGGDEVNIIRGGANHGWPLASYGIDYDDTIITELTRYPGTVQPVYYWLPSIAPSGMTFYEGDRFPGWRGDLFTGALVKQYLSRLEVDGERVLHEEILLADMKERIRDVRTGPDGYLYLLTDSDKGRLLRLEPAP